MAEGDKEGGGVAEAVLMRKRLYKFLIGFVVSVAISIMLLIALIWSVGNKPAAPTEGFVKASVALTKNMDMSVDPCNNFYDYACGGWMRSNVIPDDRNDWSNFVMLKQTTSVTLYTVFEEKQKQDTHPVYEKKVLDMYDSCMDRTALDELANDPLKDYAMSIIDAGSRNDALALATRTGVDFFLGTYIDADLADPTIYTLFVHQSAYGLALKEHYLNDTKYGEEVQKPYRAYIKDLLAKLTDNEAGANTSANTIWGFETCVADGMLDPDELRQVEDISDVTLYKDATFGSEFFEKTMESKIGSEKTVDPDSRISYVKSFVDHVDGCITSDLSDEKDFKTYLALRYIMRYSTYAQKAWRDISWGYAAKVSGVDIKPARWKSCIDLTMNVFPFAIGRIFTDEIFREDSKKSTMEMIGYIKESFESLLPDLSWMDDETREKSVAKAEAVDHKIGYPDWTYDNDKLNDYDKDVTITKDNQLENILSAMLVNMNRDFEVLNNVVDRKKWFMSPAVVNAYYNPKGNEMVFPAAILQPPFFFATHPMYVNFGSIGVVIGHELTHGFDDNGRKYDKDGKKVDWWSDEVTEKFTEQTQCMIDQYGNYTILGHPVNGRLTLGENIADNGGVKQAFRAYKNWVKKNGKEPSLPGTTITNEQAFFLSYAQIWCQKKTDIAYRDMTTQDPHSPGPQRVEGPLINSKDFAEAFNCAPGTKMAPADDSTRCTVW